MKTSKNCLRGLFLAALLLGAQVSGCVAATASDGPTAIYAAGTLD